MAARMILFFNSNPLSSLVRLTMSDVMIRDSECASAKPDAVVTGLWRAPSLYPPLERYCYYLPIICLYDTVHEQNCYHLAQ